MIPWWLASLAPLAAAQGGPCAEDSVAAVETAMAALADAYASLDEAGFDRSSKALVATVACLDEPPAPSLLARLHRAMALQSFVNGQTRASRLSMLAARLVDPGYKLPTDDFPEGHPYRDLWDAATDPGPVGPIGEIAPKRWIVDGVEREDAPLQRAFLLQVLDGDAIAWSGYLWGTGEVPDFGQNDHANPADTPVSMSLGLTAGGRFLASAQTATDATVWADQQGSALGGGSELQLRFTPISYVGAELAISAYGPDDAIGAGGSALDGHGALLVGGAILAGPQQLYGAVRLGGAWDTLRAWQASPIGVEDTRSTIGAGSVGLELGARRSGYDLNLAADYLLAGMRLPYGPRVRLQGAWRVAGPLAVTTQAGLRASSMSYLNAKDEVIGDRSDLEVRVGGGLALWL